MKIIFLLIRVAEIIYYYNYKKTNTNMGLNSAIIAPGPLLMKVL